MDKSKYKYLLLILFGVLFFSFPHKAEASTCGYSSDTVSISCYQPIRYYWKYNTTRFLTPYSAGAAWFSDFLSTGNNRANYCPNGCSFDVTEDTADGSPGALRYAYWYHVTIYAPNANGVPTPFANTPLYQTAICKGNDGSTEITVANESRFICISNASPTKIASSKSYFYSKENMGETPDPVDFSTKLLSAYEVDYKNESPFPIVWSRNYVTSTKRWIFNY